jgi:surfactin synthase thioesterase subunit
MIQSVSSSSLHLLSRSRSSTGRLLLLPPAGAGVAFWMPFCPHVAERFGEVLALRAPGRESRFSEAPAGSISQLVARALQELPDDGAALTVFGHSMGAFVALEFYVQLESSGRALPHHVVVSGRPAPGHHHRSGLHAAPRERLCEVISSYGGTPQVLLDDEMFWELFEPILRSDLRLLDEYVAPRPRLRSPVTALSGRRDPVAPPGAVEGWSEIALAGFVHYSFDGGHFFLLSSMSMVARAVCSAPIAFFAPEARK